MTSGNRICARCGGALEAGFTTAHGLIGGEPRSRPGIQFVVPGTATALDPARAFAQGLAGEPGMRRYGIAGFRCTQCGLIELYADPE